MKLYEINEEIERLTEQFEVDEDTGEILCDADALFEEIGKLQMEKQSILEYLAKVILNYKADEAALKDEETRLKNRRTILGHKIERIMNVLDRECAGEKTDLGVATFCYRKTARVDVSDSAAAVDWLAKNSHADCLRVPPPEVAKSEVKKLITAGTDIPGVELIEGYSCSLR